MKRILILAINFYQKVISVVLSGIFGIKGNCRFDPTCSNYAKESIEKFGALRGTLMTVERISKCQPFYKLSV